MLECAEDEPIFVESVSGVSHQCLLSSSDEQSGALEHFLRDRLASLKEEGLQRIVEADPSGVLALLDGKGEVIILKGIQSTK